MRHRYTILCALIAMIVVWIESRSCANPTARAYTGSSDPVVSADTSGPLSDTDKDPSAPPAAGLDVPYLNQNTVPPIRVSAEKEPFPIGQVACGCTSVAMILAYAKKVPLDRSDWVTMVHDCFRATSRVRVGVFGPEYLVGYLKKTEFPGAGFLPFEGTDTFIFTVLAAALKQGLPQLLSVRAPSSAGHYLVVTHIEGDDPQTARLVVNDPNGRWEACRTAAEKCYNNPSGDGKNVRYGFAEITREGGRLYVIRK